MKKGKGTLNRTTSSVVTSQVKKDPSCTLFRGKKMLGEEPKTEKRYPTEQKNNTTQSWEVGRKFVICWYVSWLWWYLFLGLWYGRGSSISCVRRFMIVWKSYQYLHLLGLHSWLGRVLEVCYSFSCFFCGVFLFIWKVPFPFHSLDHCWLFWLLVGTLLVYALHTQCLFCLGLLVRELFSEMFLREFIFVGNSFEDKVLEYKCWLPGRLCIFFFHRKLFGLFFYRIVVLARGLIPLYLCNVRLGLNWHGMGLLAQG